MECVAGAAVSVAEAFVAGAAVDFAAEDAVSVVAVVAVVAAALVLAVSVSVLVVLASESVLFNCFGVSENNSYLLIRKCPCMDMCRRRRFFWLIIMDKYVYIK